MFCYFVENEAPFVILTRPDRNFPLPIFKYPENSQGYKTRQKGVSPLSWPEKDVTVRNTWRSEACAHFFFYFWKTNVAGDDHILSFSLRIYHLPAPALRYSTHAGRFPVTEIFNWELNTSCSPLFKCSFILNHHTALLRTRTDLNGSHQRRGAWITPTLTTTPTPSPQHTYTTPPDTMVTWFIK